MRMARHEDQISVYVDHLPAGIFIITFQPGQEFRRGMVVIQR
jgi:hypothetical protein